MFSVTDDDFGLAVVVATVDADDVVAVDDDDVAVVVDILVNLVEFVSADLPKTLQVSRLGHLEVFLVTS